MEGTEQYHVDLQASQHCTGGLYTTLMGVLTVYSAVSIYSHGLQTGCGLRLGLRQFIMWISEVNSQHTYMNATISVFYL